MSPKPVSKSTTRRKPAGRSDRTRLWLIAGAVAALLVAVGIGVSVSRPALNRVRLPAEARDLLPDEGRGHVAEGTRVDYRTDPPTSGAHYDGTEVPAVYNRPVVHCPDDQGDEPGVPCYEKLVHNLEHGHVVVYYDPDRIPAEAMDHLLQLNARYQGDWAAVLAVPRKDDRYVAILTAWRHWLRLERYDRALVDAFVNAYMGRGPEHPVR